MILEIDAGNTLIKWRLVTEMKVILPVQRSSLDQLDEEIKKVFAIQAFSLSTVRAINIASVLGLQQNHVLEQMCRQLFGRSPLFISTTAKNKKTGLTNSYENPNSMGVDRWLCMVAAFAQSNTQCMVASLGTAVTVDVVARDGKHLGGYIVPGLDSLKSSLLAKTANVAFHKEIEVGDLALGTSTESCVNNGVLTLIIYWLESLYQQQLMVEPKTQLYLTGGNGGFVASHMKSGEVHYSPELLFEGFRWVIS